jgi:hypothetical protein
MSNTINTIKSNAGVIAKAAAIAFADELHFVKTISKADTSDFSGKNGYSSGNIIYISKPPRFTTVRDNLDISSSTATIVEEKTSLVLDDTFTIDLQLDSLELATDTNVGEIITRFIKPAATQLAHSVEQEYILQAKNATFNSVGTAGANVFDTAAILEAKTKLNKCLCPKDSNRYFLLDSAAGAAAVNARKGLFNNQDVLGKTFKSGVIGEADGFKWLESEMLPLHTNGNDVVFEVRTTVATQGQATLVVEALTTTTGTVTTGTTFTVAGVNAVHPLHKGDLGYLQQFVVTEDATADASGYATLKVSPPMYTTGTLKNITAFPADGSAITPVGSASTGYVQNLAFHADAFRFASVPLVMPTNAEFAEMYSYQDFNIAIVRGFDFYKRKMVTRLDFLSGMAAVRPEWACKVTA